MDKKLMTDDRTFLIIGPSGIGKSSAIGKIDEKDLLKFKLGNVLKDFNNEPSISDYFSRIGNENFLKQSIIAIERLKQENPNKKILIEVGAETIDGESSADLLIGYKLISLTCDKKKLYERIKNRASENRTFDQYVSFEFKQHKELLYDKAEFNIDTSFMDSQNVAAEIVRIIEKATYKYRYRPTVLNIATALFTLWAIYVICLNWPPQHEAKLAVLIFPVIIIISAAADFILQLIIRNYFWLTIVEIILMILFYRQLPA